MENFHRRGIKTKPIWIIRFRNEEEAPSTHKPPVELIIPSPENSDQWLIFNQSTYEALESLGDIQKICDLIKNECEQQAESTDENLNRAKKVSEELTHLDLLIKHFNEILKKLRTPPPETKEPD